MRLIGNKSGSGVRWVVEMTERERAAERERKAESAMSPFDGLLKVACSGQALDCAGSVAIADDPGSLGRTGLGRMEGESGGVRGKSSLLAQNTREQWGSHGVVIPRMFAVADPKEEWWERLRKNPKRLGEVSQAAFLLKARMMGYKVAIPWGDSERFDFVVWAREGARMYRVQVKGTGRLHRRGYEVQPVHSTRRRGKRRYTAKEIDVVAAHVQPLDVWYLLPIGAVGRAKSLRFYPDIESRRPRWEDYREKWGVLGETGR